MFEQASKNIDDVLWKDAGCTSELDYTPRPLFCDYARHFCAMALGSELQLGNGGES